MGKLNDAWHVGVAVLLRHLFRGTESFRSSPNSANSQRAKSSPGQDRAKTLGRRGTEVRGSHGSTGPRYLSFAIFFLLIIPRTHHLFVPMPTLSFVRLLRRGTTTIRGSWGKFTGVIPSLVGTHWQAFSDRSGLDPINKQYVHYPGLCTIIDLSISPST